MPKAKTDIDLADRNTDFLCNAPSQEQFVAVESKIQSILIINH